MGRIRWAKGEEWETLSRLALGSEAYQGYITSPPAVGIYGKVGAQVVGEVPSSIDGRPIPRMDE